jgi:farnesyl diphosphate synthase
MTFVQRLATAADLTGQRLQALINEHAPGQSTRLGGAMRHALFAGGKRFRPFLVIESAALFGLPASAAVDVATAFECVHCYSLAHDDLPAMDDDDMRRGQPTVHKAYDEWTAILAGDALLTLAFEIVAMPATHPDPGVRTELVAALAKAAGGKGMVEGQMLDLEAEKRKEPAHPTLEHVSKLQALKTAALIACACEAGAILGQAGVVERRALRRYGEELGLAFQIADDLLDAQGDAGTVGKATGKDHHAGKATMVALLGVERAQARLAQAEQNAIEALSPFGVKAATLTEAARFAASRAH